MSQEVSYAPNAAGVYVPSAVSTTGTAASVHTAVSTPIPNGTPASGYELKTTNLYTGQTGSGSSSGTGEAASAAAAAAGLPYVAPNVVNQIYNQTKNDPAMEQLKQQMLFYAQLNAGALDNGKTNGAGSGGTAGVGAAGGTTGLNKKSFMTTGGSGTSGAAGSAASGAVPGIPGTGGAGAVSGQPLNTAGVGGAGDGNGGENGAGSAWGPANFTGSAGALAYNSPIPTLSASARAAVNATGQNVWALVVVALKGAMEDQNQTLQYDLNKLKMYGTMSDQMSAYAQVLEQTQSNLDGAIQNQKDDNKKGNQEVEMPTQLSFGPSSMFTLDNNGQMLPQTVSNPENAKNNANPVSAQGLNAKLQTFQQQRDQLQKNIDHWTNQYQSDNEVKNQLTTTITSILKNMYDMQGAVTRNLNL